MFRSDSGYRYYGDEAVVRLQQIMFFQELGFSLDEIKKIVSNPDFDVLEALQQHRVMLERKAERINELLATIDKTIRELRGEMKMEIKEYYRRFRDEQIEKYRKEVKQRWGEKTLKESEERVIKMGKDKFATLQAEGGAIFSAIYSNMSLGFDSPEVQEQVARWRQWLENFSTYLDEAVAGLGQAYSQHPDFNEFFRKYGDDFPEFLTKAIEYYCNAK